jgi:hypothetical protein
MNLNLLVMAAGIGSRYGSVKQMEGIGPSGETIMDYSIYDAIQAGFNKVVFIIRKSIERDFIEHILKKYDKKIEVEYVFQEVDSLPSGVSYTPERQKPWGTGHAVLMAAENIHAPFVVINADDFYGRDAYMSVADFFRRNDNHYCMAGYQLKNTISEFGFVSRGVCDVNEESRLLSINEITHIEKRGNSIFYKNKGDEYLPLAENTTVSMNFWGFMPSLFHYLHKGFEEFIIENALNVKAEFYLPSVVNHVIKEKEEEVEVLITRGEWMGLTYKEDKPTVVRKINELINKGIYPSSLF